MRDTITAAGTQTKKDTVELGLQASTKLKLQERSELLPQLLEKGCAPGEIRTPDHLVRSLSSKP